MHENDKEMIVVLEMDNTFFFSPSLIPTRFVACRYET